jgi:hypothetical protein
VIVLERREQVAGAAISGSPFPCVNVRASRYSYLVSLFPTALLRMLGLGVELRRRRIASDTRIGDSVLLAAEGPPASLHDSALDRGSRRSDVIDFFLANIRYRDLVGDLPAQIGSIEIVADVVAEQTTHV